MPWRADSCLRKTPWTGGQSCPLLWRSVGHRRWRWLTWISAQPNAPPVRQTHSLSLAQAVTWTAAHHRHHHHYHRRRFDNPSRSCQRTESCCVCLRLNRPARRHISLPSRRHTPCRCPHGPQRPPFYNTKLRVQRPMLARPHLPRFHPTLLAIASTPCLQTRWQNLRCFGPRRPHRCWEGEEGGWILVCPLPGHL